MSFILDALKKSEHERQRQAVPGLIESTGVRPKQRLPTWAIAVCALLGINLIVLLAVLTRGWLTSPPPVPAKAATHRDVMPDQTRAPEDVPTDRQFSPLDTAPVYAPEIPVSPSVPSQQPPQPQSQSQSQSTVQRLSASSGGSLRSGSFGSFGSSGAHAIRRRDPLLNDGDYKADEEETLPSINELNLTGAQALPELHLDVHVFATTSAERFVFINMRKYHEGATLLEGPRVERIRRDGVILDYQGLRFLLPRQ